MTAETVRSMLSAAPAIFTDPSKPPAAKPVPEAPTVAPFITVEVGPRNATTDPATGLRFYRWQDRDLPSVTTVRRMAGIPHGLHQWSLTQVINRVLDTASDIAGRVSKGDPKDLAALRKELRGAATSERDKAAKLGTEVHDAASTGRALSDVPPAVRPRLRQYLSWLAESRAEILASEFQLWNLTVGYAGTADLLCRFPDGSVWLIDLKTGKGVYSEHALQLIAYLMSEFSGSDNIVDEQTTALLHQARGMAVLHLGDRSWEFRVLRADPDTWAAFRGLLEFARWSKEHPDADAVTLGRRSRGDER